MLHKPEFSKDYKDRLLKMNSDFKNFDDEGSCLKLLQDWLIKNEYLVTKPIDKSVQFNDINAKKLSPLVYKDDEEIKNIINEKNRLEEENFRLKEELNKLYNSKSWKSTEILRKISSKFKNGD